jgi:hypothetical protein
MVEVKGKANIVARILADSISEQGHRLTTWEVEYPRIIHSELMTHRMFSRNAASSRAIPFAKMVEQLTGRPVRFGANQAGMQDAGEDFNASVEVPEYEDMSWEACAQALPEQAWEGAKYSAMTFASAFAEAGYHKQITGRLTEPFQMMKTIISATETSNFFWLRDDEAADPTIAELARCMKQSYDESAPRTLFSGEYHLPYIASKWNGIVCERTYYLDEECTQEIALEDAIKVSCARCAAVSYRNNGYGLEKSLEVYERLLGSDKKHASAFEHVATPMGNPRGVSECRGSCYGFDVDAEWGAGVSHMDREGNLWSGNFKGWVQYRKTIDGENYTDS